MGKDGGNHTDLNVNIKNSCVEPKKCTKKKKRQRDDIPTCPYTPPHTHTFMHAHMRMPHSHAKFSLTIVSNRPPLKDNASI